MSLTFPLSHDPAPSEIVANSHLRAELIRRAQEGDDLAFKVLYFGYYKLIWTLLWNTVGQNAEDLVQETFFHAWKKLSTVDCNSAFVPWLKKIAANLAVDELRRKNIIHFSPLSERDEEDYDDGFEQTVFVKDCMEMAFSTLSGRTRTCIILADQWGFSEREIAELLKITKKTVSSYLSRGRQRFRDEYRRLTGGGPSVKRKGETAS